MINLDLGPDKPPALCAEIGINHNGNLSDALEMIKLAQMSGADMVKFQKREPRVCVPRGQWDTPRDTPWGVMPYIEYKERMEFGKDEYDAIDAYCKEIGIPWFVSVWDEESVDFISRYDLPVLKIGSASLTDQPLIDAVKATGKDIILSTGMSTRGEIVRTVESWLGDVHDRLIVCHSTSIYPCPNSKLNMRFITELRRTWPNLVIGYSGHERGTIVTAQAVALGASYIERHFTLDRFGWGTDQAASIEHWQFKTVAEQCKAMWVALGDGVKVVYPEEAEKAVTLRRG